jgi:glycosyltransferase involved in cell wall biosynthesis
MTDAKRSTVVHHKQVRVLIDARPAASPKRTGIGHYTWSLLRHLPPVDPGTTYIAWYLAARDLLSGRRSRHRFRPAPNLRERAVPFPTRWFQPLADRLDLPRVEWFSSFDVLFAPNFLPPPTRAPRVVLTVHDLAFRLFPNLVPERTLDWLSGFDEALRRATRVIAVSECTRRDLLEHFDVDPERVAVVHHGVDHDVYRPAGPGGASHDPVVHAIGGPFLLSLGGIEPRKNLPRLVRAFASLRPDLEVRLVVAGSGVPRNPEGRIALQAELASLPEGVRRRVILTGHVPQETKVRLLQSAFALVLPSLYEGFGLPVLEAMACGTPVVSSNVSALPEIAGRAAVLVDPLDIESIREGMERVLVDAALRRRLRRAGILRAGKFTWGQTAVSTARVLHEAASTG